MHSLAELTLNGNCVADDATVSDRVRLHDIPATLTRALESHRDLAQLLSDAALDPRLSVNAFAAQRVISHLASGSMEAPSPNEPWLAPRDIALTRDGAQPAPARGVMKRQIADVDDAAQRLVSAGADLARATPLAAADDRLAGNEASPQFAVTATGASPLASRHRAGSGVRTPVSCTARDGTVASSRVPVAGRTTGRGLKVRCRRTTQCAATALV